MKKIHAFITLLALVFLGGCSFQDEMEKIEPEIALAETSDCNWKTGAVDDIEITSRIIAYNAQHSIATPISFEFPNSAISVLTSRIPHENNNESCNNGIAVYFGLKKAGDPSSLVLMLVAVSGTSVIFDGQTTLGQRQDVLMSGANNEGRTYPACMEALAGQNFSSQTNYEWISQGKAKTYKDNFKGQFLTSTGLPNQCPIPNCGGKWFSSYVYQEGMIDHHMTADGGTGIRFYLGMKSNGEHTCAISAIDILSGCTICTAGDHSEYFLIDWAPPCPTNCPSFN